MSEDIKSISPNLFVRFLLEIIALVAFGLWGGSINTGFWRITFALLAPLSIAIIWGVFAVPNDPSRSGNAPIKVSGIVRIVIELCIFTLAVLILLYLDYTTFGFIYVVAIALHYLFSYERILWLLKQK